MRDDNAKCRFRKESNCMEKLTTYLELHKDEEIYVSEIVNILKQYDEETFS